MELEIGADGSVVSVCVAVTSGHADLDEAALRAVRAARFIPAKSGGRPVAASARLTLQFRLK